MSEELKPCPHCGASGGDLAIRFTGYVEAPDITIDYFVHCFNCGAETGMSMNAKYAVKAWNRRVEPIGNPGELYSVIDMRIEELEEMIECNNTYRARDLVLHEITTLKWVLSLRRDE
jgi:hypothetical protein